MIDHEIAWKILEMLPDVCGFFERERIASLCLGDFFIHHTANGGAASHKVSMTAWCMHACMLIGCSYRCYTI